MTVMLSSGLRNSLLGTGTTGGAPMSSQFANGVMYIYSGPQPLNADQAVQGTLLLVITNTAGTFNFGTATNGLLLGTGVSGVIAKATAQTWQGVAAATGTAGWARLMGNASDNLGVSTTLPRIDMSVGTAGADLNLSSVNIAAGAPTTVDVWQFTLPAN